MGRLSGKTALVTGASSGIGRSCARALAREGARIVAAARRLDRIEKLCEEIEADFEVAAHPLALDVRKRAEVLAAIESLGSGGWDPIDILVNNAGLAAGLEKIDSGDFDKWDRMLDTNVRGLLNVTRAVLPGMVARSSGHVVNIGSIAGREVYPSGNVYCATKSAVRALNKAMRVDTCGAGVRVTTVDPGMVRTEFSLVRFDGDPSRAETPYRGMTPLAPDDVADAVAWAVTRPPHVNVEEVLLMPTDQASAHDVHRRSE